MLMKYHVQHQSTRLGFIFPNGLHAAIAQAEAALHRAEQRRGKVGKTRRLWIPIQTSAFSSSVHGIQTSVLDFCQPVMTLAELTFPCWDVSR